MLSIFEIMGRIAIDNGGADKALDETAANAREAGAKISSAFESIGNKAVAIGKTIAAGLAVGTAAIGALTVGAMKQAGELEQNMGGSEAVFKEHAEKMQETAKTAYKNMGLSASSFLATANKMGALFQGVGFTIEESADISAAAMQRAADVASIMGVDLEWAMESIAGAAKGNFTMMDNLGVAINDTTLNMYALEKGIDKTTDQMTTQEKVALAMQLFMEKTAYATGNYAKENETLAGSLSTAKAALDNFLSGAGDATELAEAVMSAAEVILTKLDTLLPSLVTGIGQLVKKLAPKLPGLLMKLVPNAVDAMGGIIRAILPELPRMIAELAPVLIEGAKDLGKAMIEAIKETIPVLEEVFEDLGIRLSDLLVMIGGVVLAFKGFSIVSTVISAIKTLKTAFVGLNAVLAANPIGLVVTALGLLVTWIGIMRDAANRTIEPAYELSDAEKAIRDRANEAADAHKRMTESFADDAAGITSETQRTKELWAELQTLCDENGNVKEAYQDRAAFIADELEKATGIEIELVDGTIQKYQELIGTMDTLIAKQHAEAILSAARGRYDQAVQDKQDLQQAEMDALYKLAAEQKALDDAKATIAGNQEILDYYGMDSAGALAAGYDLQALDAEIDALNHSMASLESNLAEAQAAADEATQNLKDCNQTIVDYDNAYLEAMQGNYELAADILTEDVSRRWQRAAELGKLSEEEMAQLKTDIDQAIKQVALYKQRMAEGWAGYNEETVNAAIQNLHDLQAVYAEQQIQAAQAGQDVGRELAGGVSAGLEEKSGEIRIKARNFMQSAITAMKDAAQIASPSKVTAQFGRYLVEGLSEGISDSQHMAEAAASDAMYRTTGGFAQGLTNSHGSASESSGEEMRELNHKVETLLRDLPDMMAEAFANMSLKINNREFGRMVRAVE